MAQHDKGTDILKIKNLCTSFLTSNGKVKAVRGVSFSLRKGEVLGVVGESGSGKTVTSMSIVKLLASTGIIESGEIIFDGQDLTKAGTKELRKIRGNRIAMVFQDPMCSLNPLMPVGKQIMEMMKEHNRNMRPAELKAESLRLLELVKIPEAAQRYGSYPHEFSGGMRQRVMIAMALACKPDILIADEPTTALDVTIQDQILRLLKQLREEMQMSIIFITHDLGVVAEICDRVVVMYGGMIMEEGPIEAIYNQPSHPYTRGLLASVPDVSQDKSIRLVSIPGSPPDMLKPPEGCPFAPRCPYARNVCAACIPPVTNVDEGHKALCWLLTPEAPRENNPFKQAGTQYGK